MTAPEKRKPPGPRGEVGRGKPGRKLRRSCGSVGSVKAWARTTELGLAWLKRKRAGR